MMFLAMLLINVYSLSVNQKTYQLLNILSPNVDATKVKDIIDAACMFNNDECHISHESRMIDLAYKMKHNHQGYLVSTILKISPERMDNIKSKLSLNDDVLRTLIVTSASSDFNVGDDMIQTLSSYTTKRGKIVFPKNCSRSFKSKNARYIKRFRYLGLLPYCNYYV